MRAVVVVDKHPAIRLRVTAQHVPHRRDVLRSLEMAHVGESAGGHDHDVRTLGGDIAGICERVQSNVDAEPLDSITQPVRNAGQLPAPRRPRREQDLTAERVRGFEQDHIVTALRAHPCRLQTAAAAAHDYDAPPRSR